MWPDWVYCYFPKPAGQHYAGSPRHIVQGFHLVNFMLAKLRLLVAHFLRWVLRYCSPGFIYLSWAQVHEILLSWGVGEREGQGPFIFIFCICCILGNSPWSCALPCQFSRSLHTLSHGLHPAPCLSIPHVNSTYRSPGEPSFHGALQSLIV